MKARTKRKLRVAGHVLLAYLDELLDGIFVPSKSESLRHIWRMTNKNWDSEFWKLYYASSVRDGVERLKRKGQVVVTQVEGGWEIKITDKGRTEVIKGKLGNFGIPKMEKWDGKWRLVFFDVAEISRSRRNTFREWLIKLGLRPIQKSVYIFPYPLEQQIKFIREVVNVPDGVKMAVVEQIENDEDLREWFDL